MDEATLIRIADRLKQLGAFWCIEADGERAIVSFRNALHIEVHGDNRAQIAPILAQLPADVRSLLNEIERLRER